MLFLLAFQPKNWFRLLQGAGHDAPFGKDVLYRFLNHPRYAWRTFLLSLSAAMVNRFDPLTTKQRIRAFILDDSTYSRNRSKTVELLARVKDHTTGRFVRGFRMLTLGWSDGHSFVPVDFALLSSANKENRFCEMSEQLDRRTHGYKRRQEALMPSPTVSSRLLDHALQAGIRADYVLMDTWFTRAPLIEAIHRKGLFVIGLVKDLKQRYRHGQGLATLSELRGACRRIQKRGDILGSVLVSLPCGIPLKIVFIENRNHRSEWLAVLSTDCSLCDEEIVRIYGIRWKIESFFKVTKSHLRLAQEFQGRSYDMLISHTTIVFARYLFLEWEARKATDPRSLGELFFWLCDEVKTLDYTTAIQFLWSVFQQVASGACSIRQVQRQVQDWIQALPNYIKACLSFLPCES